MNDLNQSNLEDPYEWRSYAIKATKETKIKRSGISYPRAKSDARAMRFKPLD